MVADEVLSILHTYGANADGNVIEPAAQKKNNFKFTTPAETTQ